MFNVKQLCLLLIEIFFKSNALLPRLHECLFSTRLQEVRVPQHELCVLCLHSATKNLGGKFLLEGGHQLDAREVVLLVLLPLEESDGSDDVQLVAVLLH